MLRDLRLWLFEIIAIILPGTMVVVLVTEFIVSPTSLITLKIDWPRLEGILSPLNLSVLNAMLIVAIGFCAGHILQALLNRAYNVFSAVFRVEDPRQYYVGWFNNAAVKEMLLPQSFGMSGEMLKLDEWAYSDIWYSQYIPKAREETFTAVADFCGGMAVVTTAFMILLIPSAIDCLVGGLGRPVLYVIPEELVAYVLTVLWMGRSAFCKRMIFNAIIGAYLFTLSREQRRCSEAAGGQDGSKQRAKGHETIDG